MLLQQMQAAVAALPTSASTRRATLRVAMPLPGPAAQGRWGHHHSLLVRASLNPPAAAALGNSQQPLQRQLKGQSQRRHMTALLAPCMTPESRQAERHAREGVLIIPAIAAEKKGAAECGVRDEGVEGGWGRMMCATHAVPGVRAVRAVRAVHAVRPVRAVCHVVCVLEAWVLCDAACVCVVV